jgi:hypothetical protein
VKSKQNPRPEIKVTFNISKIKIYLVSNQYPRFEIFFFFHSFFSISEPYIHTLLPPPSQPKQMEVTIYSALFSM